MYSASLGLFSHSGTISCPVEAPRPHTSWLSVLISTPISFFNIAVSVIPSRKYTQSWTASACFVVHGVRHDHPVESLRPTQWRAQPDLLVRRLFIEHICTVRWKFDFKYASLAEKLATACEKQLLFAHTLNSTSMSALVSCNISVRFNSSSK